MNTFQRILIILQLCISFSLILWFFGQPFFGEYFALRSRMLPYEFVMGTSEIIKNTEKMKSNAARFDLLNPETKQIILNHYKKIQQHANRPFWIKLVDGIRLFILEIPLFLLGWMIFAAVICIFCLCRPELKNVVWILPLITFLYIIDNSFNGRMPKIEKDAVLFPTEKLLVEKYSDEENGKILNDAHRLQKAWENYLIANWSINKSIQNNETKLNEAEFNFTVARLNLLQKESIHNWLHPFREKENPFLLILYLIWNIYFAYWISKDFSKTDLKKSM